MTASAILSRALQDTFVQEYPRLVAQLAHKYRSTPPERVEDAVSEAFTQLLATDTRPDAALGRAWANHGYIGIKRLAYTVAWRHLRGEHRRTRARRERYPGRVPDAAHEGDAAGRVEAGETLARVNRLLLIAARRFGRRRTAEFAEALEDRLESGDSDVEVAARHGVDRADLCRARGWIEEAL